MLNNNYLILIIIIIIIKYSLYSCTDVQTNASLTLSYIRLIVRLKSNIEAICHLFRNRLFSDETDAS